ncbi:MAG TPA: Kiwa anti-phage protein KwaB-like domain-containing protein [Bacteroidia bacterium]|nr:Kiwa anti-phage protein KwaB-like domain-containing protein [Bacteroidia bacterium]
MEKGQLVTALSNIITNPILSVDLYFVFKHEDTYVQYLANPNDDLRTEIISGYTGFLQTFINPDNPYELNDIYDDNEYEDYHLFFDTITNNDIAQAIFLFSRPDALPYTTAAGPLSKIHGFIIELSDGTNYLTLYKRNQATHAVNPDKMINFFTGADNQLKLINQSAIYLTKSIDLFKIDNTIFINSRSVYENQFGFVAQLKARAETGFVDLSAITAFDIDISVQDYVKKLPKGMLKKLSTVATSNPIIEQEKWTEITRQARRYARHEFDTRADGAIKIQTKKELIILINILNRDYNYNTASKERYLTKNKKLIN